jgi:hypothetical protein
VKWESPSFREGSSQKYEHDKVEAWSSRPSRPSGGWTLQVPQSVGKEYSPGFSGVFVAEHECVTEQRKMFAIFIISFMWIKLKKPRFTGEWHEL